MPPARPTTRSPQISPLRLGDLDDGDPDELLAKADLEAVRFAGLSLPGLAIPGGVANAVRFTGLHVDQADLTATRFSEVELDQVHLPVVRASRTQWRDVRVSGRIGGLEAYEAQWRSVHFEGCKLDYLNLRSAELVDVAFTDCVIGELDLLDAVVRRVGFRDARVTSLDVQHARLTDLDLRGAQLESIAGVMDLRGATVTHQQLQLLAPLLAGEVGLRVED